MASRPFMIAALVGASIGVPYVVSETSKDTWGLGGGAAEDAAEDSWSTPSTPQPSAIAAPLERAEIHSIEQVFRFDLTKEWVYGNWARKSTGPTDVGLQSVRVSLVTGTRVHDLAGSLTYFFNAQGQVEHISFRGRAGDTRPLVEFLMRTYEFRRESAPPGEELYRVRRIGRPQSELRTRPEAVLRSNSPHSSFAVELELARPGSKRLLPPRGAPLAIPPVAGTPAGGDIAADSGEAKPSDGSFLDKLRFATPEEQSQLHRMRWPN